MRPSIRRATLTVAFAALGLLAATGVAADDGKPGGGTGFSGTWALVAAKDDMAAKTKKGGWNVLGSAESPGSMRTGGGGFDVPLEVIDRCSPSRRLGRRDVDSGHLPVGPEEDLRHGRSRTDPRRQYP